MNLCLTKTQNENNGKFNYFNLLIEKDLIKLPTDLVESRIKPKFGKFNSSFEFLNNILNSVMTKKLLFNFSQNVREFKYNKMENNFENLLKFNRPLFQETLLEEIKEALNNTPLVIPRGYDKYDMNMNFKNNLCYSLPKFIFKTLFTSKLEYITPTKYKKFLLTEIEEMINDPNFTNEYLLNCFRKAFKHLWCYYSKGNAHSPITVNYNINYSNHKKESKTSHSNKLSMLLMK